MGEIAKCSRSGFGLVVLTMVRGGGERVEVAVVAVSMRSVMNDCKILCLLWGENKPKPRPHAVPAGLKLRNAFGDE